MSCASALRLEIVVHTSWLGMARCQGDSCSLPDGLLHEVPINLHLLDFPGSWSAERIPRLRPELRLPRRVSGKLALDQALVQTR
ncbi:hypothetical protein B0H21DRAFT_742457 [Amylocystis lapponica]|nr:hypothetical protein B0H21DRAFT_742457 [Amylocystis lapponica]